MLSYCRTCQSINPVGLSSYSNVAVLDTTAMSDADLIEKLIIFLNSSAVILAD